jgi:hypothetical protein
MAVQGQPDNVDWDFDVADLKALETGGLAPSGIINAPNNFKLRTSLQNAGGFSTMIHGKTGTIQYRAERLEDNTVVTLASTSFTVPVAINFDVDSAVFTSGAGNNLPDGTYMLTAIVSMDNLPEKAIVAGFNQTILRVI